MMIARWSIDARFGYKPMVIDLMKRWSNEIGAKVGWGPGKMRMVTGSVGALESTVQSEIQIRDLAELNAAWDKLTTIEEHKSWSKEIEPYVVSGTPRWEIFRIIE